jgi:DNA-binding LacI/PurR family transcriptional regulator
LLKKWKKMQQPSSARRPTSADVAELARVSRATVSYVLNSTPNQKISPATRTAVLSAARALGYRPNIAAKNLAAGESGVIVFVMPRTAFGELSSSIGSHLTKELARSGITVAVHVDADSAALLELCGDLHPRAVVSMFPLPADLRQDLRDRGINAISSLDGDSQPFRTMNQSGATKQIEYLYSRGHRSIAYARPDLPELAELIEQRNEAAAAACSRLGLPGLRVGTFENDGRGANQTVKDWFDGGVTAICAYNDETAFTVLHGIRSAGLECPRDMAVIGLDGIPLAAVAAPPLSTIAIAPARAAHFYGALLLQLLGVSSELDEPGTVFSLVERVSA